MTTSRDSDKMSNSDALAGLKHLLDELPDHDFRLERHGLTTAIAALTAGGG